MEEKNNGVFSFAEKDGRIIITKYMLPCEEVVIPDQVEGMPVTELGDYVFCGHCCKRVFLPKELKKIGRYGFYNCRNLTELSFYSNFSDIGTGAFTGCHQIHRLEITMDREDTCLKEILSEVGEELLVRIKGIMDAMLMFPEYYEEGVENTPARILMTQIHGSGLYYRNCFQGKKFNFAEYDKRFEMACAQESPAFLTDLVYGRLAFPEGLTPNAKLEYETYLQSHELEMALSFIKNNREEELEWLLQTYPLGKDKKEEFRCLTDAASAQNNPSVTGLLMEYQRVHFPAKRRSFEL